PGRAAAERHLARGVEPAADLVLHGGRIWTVDRTRPEARGVAVRDGRIVAVGSDADALATAGPRTQVVDLRGRLVLPGFIDGHTHFGNAALWAFEVPVSGLRDPSGVVGAVAAAARRVPPGLWV